MFYDVFEKLCTEKGVKPGRAAILAIRYFFYIVLFD